MSEIKAGAEDVPVQKSTVVGRFGLLEAFPVTFYWLLFASESSYWSLEMLSNLHCCNAIQSY